MEEFNNQIGDTFHFKKTLFNKLKTDNANDTETVSFNIEKLLINTAGDLKSISFIKGCSGYGIKNIPTCYTCKINPGTCRLLENGLIICDLCKTNLVNEVCRERGYLDALKTKELFKPL